MKKRKGKEDTKSLWVQETAPNIIDEKYFA